MTKEMRRENFRLTAAQMVEFEQLGKRYPLPGEAFAFWRKVCAIHGLDVKSVIAKGEGHYSAMRTGHNVHWCYPQSLRCPRPVSRFLQEKW